MEDRHPSLPSLPPATADTYRCPGESYVIDRAAHLGRLASFYPGCRACVHRHDTHSLSPIEIERWTEIGRRDDGLPRFTAESLAAKSPSEMQPAVVRQFAAALGSSLWRGDEGRRQPPAVLIGTDGHWTTAELVSAACESLQWAGCRVIDTGGVTCAALARAAVQLETDAALWVGNAGGEPHAIDLKLWGPRGMPWSSPGQVDLVREIHQSKVDRPKRRGGGLERVVVEESYLASFHPLFHALRPLRIVIDTKCEPFLRYLGQLVAHAACEILRPGQLVNRPSRSDISGTTAGLSSSEAILGGRAIRPAGHHGPLQAPAGLSTATDANKPFLERRLAIVGRNVVANAAHFGLWISGDAEACHLVDQHGAPVDGERLLLRLAVSVCRERPHAIMVLEQEAGGQLDSALAGLGARAIRGNSTRQAMCEMIETSGAVFGGGPSGRFWYSGSPAAPDVLLTTSLLLTILSESDRSVSDVLDAV